MNFLTALVAGIVPMLIYPLFLYWMDRYEKEPLLLIGAAFLWGFVPAALLSLISQLLLGVPFLLFDSSGALGNMVTGVAVAPLTEEFFKGLAVLAIYNFWRNEFDGVFDGIIYGGLVGFGFAAVENVLYFIDADSTVIVLRTVAFGLNHAFYTSLTGIGFGVARHTRQVGVRFAAPLLGFAAAIAAHGLHNLTVTFAGDWPALFCLAVAADWTGVLFVLVIMVLAVRRERRWLVDELRDEVELETLSENQYALVASPVRRFSARLEALLMGGLAAYWRVGRYFNALTELAYKKNANRRRGEAGAKGELVARLRKQAAALSADMTDLR